MIFEDEFRKLWTGDTEIWQILDQYEEAGELPFFSGIEVDYSGQYRKMNFVPASKFGMKVPSDEDLEELGNKLNVKLKK